MVDPITITGLVAAILSVILGGSGPILPRLWSSLKRLYGRACQTTSYLANINQERLKGDLQSILLENAVLRVQAERYYLQGGMARANSRRILSGGGFGNAGGAQSGSGNREVVEFSDFSDFSD